MDEERLCHDDDRKGKVADLPRTLCSGQGPQQKQKLECFSDEVNSRDGTEETKNAGGPSGAAGGDGPTGAIGPGKRRRGRPQGSKNKPRPPVVVTRETEPAAALRPHLLEIPVGGDVAGALAAFARRRGIGICVLAGTGAVADVSLRHASAAEDGAAIVFQGQYEILSISATFLPPSMSGAVPRAFGALSISLAAPHGRIVGGAVAGPLVAATTVVVLAAAFADLTFHRLPADDADASESVSGSGEAEEHRGIQQEPQHASRLQPHTMVAAAQPLYARQPHEAWAPAASTPRPPAPYQ